MKTAKKEKAVEVLMPEEDKNLLKELYVIRSYSGYEEPLRNKIKEVLHNLNVPYINYNGNILGFNYPGAPLFSAHLDMVNTEYYKLKGDENSVTGGVFTIDTEANIRLYRDKEKTQQTSLGADDKNGVWVILELLKAGKRINFAFCHSEEVGGTGSNQVISDPELGEFISGCKYGVVIDRRNKGDIIGYGNKYCMCMDDKLSKFSKEIGIDYEPAHGSCSDADKFSQIIECVNISCGYYEPHTSREYTNLNELWNTFLLCEQMVDNFNYETVSSKRMQDFKNCSCPYRKVVETMWTRADLKNDKEDARRSEKKSAGNARDIDDDDDDDYSGWRRSRYFADYNQRFYSGYNGYPRY